MYFRIEGKELFQDGLYTVHGITVKKQELGTIVTKKAQLKHT